MSVLAFIHPIQFVSYAGDYSNLLALGGNFGCGLSVRDDFVGSDYVCQDNYQQTITLANNPTATKMIVCIRLPPELSTIDSLQKVQNSIVGER